MGFSMKAMTAAALLCLGCQMAVAQCQLDAPSGDALSMRGAGGGGELMKVMTVPAARELGAPPPVAALQIAPTRASTPAIAATPEPEPAHGRNLLLVSLALMAGIALRRADRGAR